MMFHLDFSGSGLIGDEHLGFMKGEQFLVRATQIRKKDSLPQLTL